MLFYWYHNMSHSLGVGADINWDEETILFGNIYMISTQQIFMRCTPYALIKIFKGYKTLNHKKFVCNLWSHQVQSVSTFAITMDFKASREVGRCGLDLT